MHPSGRSPGPPSLLAIVVTVFALAVVGCGSTETVSCARNTAGTKASCEKSSQSSVEAWAGDATTWVGGHLWITLLGVGGVCWLVSASVDSATSGAKDKSSATKAEKR